MDFLLQLAPLALFVLWGLLRYARFLRSADRRSTPGDGSLLLPSSLRWWFAAELQPIVAWFVRREVSPNTLTVVGALITLAAAIGMGLRWLPWAGYVLLVGSLMDMFDGRVARTRKRESRRGAFLDSTLDRYADMTVFLALAVGYRDSWVGFVGLFALIGVVVVSYTRARAEGLGVECHEGFLQRPERVVIVGFAAVLDPALSALIAGWVGEPGSYVLPAALVAVAALAHFTAIQRIVSVYRKLD